MRFGWDWVLGSNSSRPARPHHHFTEDGRRVIVRLAKSADGAQERDPLFASLGNAWGVLADSYDDEHKAFLLEFLQRSNALASEEKENETNHLARGC